MYILINIYLVSYILILFSEYIYGISLGVPQVMHRGYTTVSLSVHLSKGDLGSFAFYTALRVVLP